MINWMMKKAVRLQKQMMDTLEQENPELYAQAVNKPIYCSYCGAKNLRTDTKCCNCGAIIEKN